MFCPSKINPSDVIILVLPEVFKIFLFLSYLANSENNLLFWSSSALTSPFKIIIFWTLSTLTSVAFIFNSFEDSESYLNNVTNRIKQKK